MIAIGVFASMRSVRPDNFPNIVVRRQVHQLSNGDVDDNLHIVGVKYRSFAPGETFFKASNVCVTARLRMDNAARSGGELPLRQNVGCHYGLSRQ